MHENFSRWPEKELKSRNIVKLEYENEVTDSQKDRAHKHNELFRRKS